GSAEHYTPQGQQAPAHGQDSQMGNSSLPAKATGRGFIEGGFLETSEGGGFRVDKSLLCRVFLECESYVVRVSLPPRFGKSFNLSVLEQFFNVVTMNDCPQGTEEPNLDAACELRERRFANSLLKQRHPEFFKTHFAHYPVIRIDFQASPPLWLQYA
ncbi:hypothetical protein LPJ61_006680, partial [Coemansia biformis]